MPTGIKVYYNQYYRYFAQIQIQHPFEQPFNARCTLIHLELRLSMVFTLVPSLARLDDTLSTVTTLAGAGGGT